MTTEEREAWDKMTYSEKWRNDFQKGATMFGNLSLDGADIQITLNMYKNPLYLTQQMEVIFHKIWKLYNFPPDRKPF